MPQGGPTRELLKRLGFTLPPDTPPLTEEQQRLLDARAYEQQAKDPLWKKLGRGLVDTVGGFAEGLVGAEPKSVKDAGVSDYANLGGQILTSGLPFGAYKKMLPFGKIFHGTPKEFKIFDPSKYDKSDTLGWLTHFAEDPSYASQYATGQMKHSPAPNWAGGSGNRDSFRPRTIPAEPQARNVLDLVDPNSDDISAALASVDSYNRTDLLKKFKDVRREARESGSTPGNIESHYFKTSHYPERNVPIDQPATRAVAESLQLTPEQFDKSPFDAIRYNDVNEKSWAIPERTPVQTPWGTPLTNNPKTFNVFKSDKSGGGTLEVDPNRWKNTPLSLPETPHPELMKEDVTGNLWEAYKKNLNADKFTGKTTDEIIQQTKNEAYEVFDPVSGKTVAWVNTPEEVLEHIKLNPNLDYLGPGGKPVNIPGADEIPGIWKKYEPTKELLNAKLNNLYTPEQSKELLKQAEYLGIDWNKYPNYKELEAAIVKHPNYPK